MIRSATIALLMTATAACSPETAGVCGEAEEYRDGGDLFCVIRDPVLIEEGFVCPDEAPRMIETEDGGICAPPDREGDAEEVYERYLAQREKDFLNNGQADAGGLDMRGEVVDFGLPPADFGADACEAGFDAAYGYRVDVSAGCRETQDPELFVGCIEEVPGLASVSCWLSPDGTAMYHAPIAYEAREFPWDGWTRCDETTFGGREWGSLPICGEAPDCLEVPVGQCGDYPECEVQTGKRLDVENQCYGAESPAICLPAGYVCDGAIVTVTEPDGGCWLLTGHCGLPVDWILEEDDRTCPYLGEVPDCDP